MSCVVVHLKACRVAPPGIILVDHRVNRDKAIGVYNDIGWDRGFRRHHSISIDSDINHSVSDVVAHLA